MFLILKIFVILGLLNTEDFNNSPNTNMVNCVQLIHPDCPDVILLGDTTLSQILAVLHNRGYSLSASCNVM